MTIIEAIINVLKKHNKSLSINEIFEGIKENNFYSFNTESPKSVIRAQLKRHLENTNIANASKTKYFQESEKGKFTLIK